MGLRYDFPSWMSSFPQGYDFIKKKLNFPPDLWVSLEPEFQIPHIFCACLTGSQHVGWFDLSVAAGYIIHMKLFIVMGVSWVIKISHKIAS